ncbi:MAPEG family protein [Glacieibacterium sp.]|uniref:MAPEG family protein n=1 Tax=Glacieibacterium sp. TaxID=2860237 RepID=UPI003B000669
MLVTLATAGFCGLILFVLSLRVSQARGMARVSIGDGGDPLLIARMRAQANFTEFVPIILIMFGLIEVNLVPGGVGQLLLGITGILLVVVRIAHAMGMVTVTPPLSRKIGAGGTFLILLGTSIAALVLSARLHGLF